MDTMPRTTEPKVQFRKIVTLRADMYRHKLSVKKVAERSGHSLFYLYRVFNQRKPCTERMYRDLKTAIRDLKESSP